MEAAGAFQASELSDRIYFVTSLLTIILIFADDRTSNIATPRKNFWGLLSLKYCYVTYHRSKFTPFAKPSLFRMEAAGSYETSVHICRTTWSHIWEGYNFNFAAAGTSNFALLFLCVHSFTHTQARGRPVSAKYGLQTPDVVMILSWAQE
jgi:hypothetical protein